MSVTTLIRGASKRSEGIIAMICWPIAIFAFLGIAGCSAASPTSKPTETATAETPVQPVVTGDAASILTEVDNRIKQTTNEVWPWLIGLGIVVLAGCGLVVAILAMGFWLIRRWIESNSYLRQKPVYEAKCAKL